jgi:NAD(P)-dependent dehydrogenase (short-subunit alcohol dehydrogenase family)
MEPDYRLAFITGAAQRLGKAIAQELAAHGYAIGLHYFKSSEQAQKTALELENLGVPVFIFQADLRVPRQIQQMFEKVAVCPCPLEVLVNSAAVMPREEFRSMAVEEWDSIVNLNLRAPWLCAQHAASLMEPEGGVIINISDAGAGRAWTGYPAYSVTKAGIETLTRVLARVLAPKIRVNGVAPGLILPSPELSPGEWQRLVNRLPLKRPGSPEDIARAILYLVENDYITGQILAVDGGFQLT